MMGRTRAARFALAGTLALGAGIAMLTGAAIDAAMGPAYADSAPLEVYCPGTPIGGIVLNDATVTGTISPAAPTSGQQFSLQGVQEQVTVPASIVQAAAAIGNTSLTGSISATIDATGASPSSTGTGANAFSVPIPDPVPSTGLVITAPSPPVTVGPFTATGGDITLSVDPTIHITFDDASDQLALTCSLYPNNTVPSGTTGQPPPGIPVSPVVATTGSAPPPQPPSLTGAYELYCPHTPVGDLVFNDVTTSASVPSDVSVGQPFSVTDYQTQIPLPPGVVSAAAGLNNTSFDGLAATDVDAYGASPDQLASGSMAFDVAIPDPVPASPLDVPIPSSPTSVGSFTASAPGSVTIAQDQSMLVVASLSDEAFKMTCTAYPNDTIAASGSTGSAPAAAPIRPIIALTTATGSPLQTTTTEPGPPGPPSPVTGPFEMYCPGSPVGDLVLNDTTLTASITPSTLTSGQQFELTGMQTQFSIPQAVAQQAENLGITTVSGDIAMFLFGTGVEGDGVYLGTGISSTGVSSGSAGSVYLPYPGPYPSVADMPFSVTLPDPVPAGGVQFTAVVPTGQEPTFTAAGGPIQITIGGINLNVTAFGDTFGLFCNTYPNDTEPTGIATVPPTVAPVEPLVASGQATVVPPPPAPPGAYELFCPGTPIGSIVLNDVTTTGTLSPSSPSAGQTFSLDGYQTQVPLPANLVAAASAFGSSLDGSVTTSVDASGAAPGTLSLGPQDFSIPIPSPPTSLDVVVPSPAGTIGPFTATASPVTLTADASTTVTLLVSGEPLTLSCTAYANDSLPTGTTSSAPPGSPIAPIIASTGGTTPPPPTTTTGPYELYCPGTPIGNVVLNDVTTTGTISPSAPSAGQSFSLDGYQTQVPLPANLVTAASAFGSSLDGSVTASIDASGGTPATMPAGDMGFSLPIPSPPAAVTVDVPSSPGSIGPFTATGSPITLTAGGPTSLTLIISGNPLTLTCSDYANDSLPTGTTESAPPGSAIAPVIATATSTVPVSTTPTTPSPPTTTGGGGGSIQTVSTTSPDDTTTSTAPTLASSSSSTSGSSGSGSTADAATTASSGSLAYTGPGAATTWTVLVGALLVLLGIVLLLLVDAPRRMLARLSTTGSTHTPAAARLRARSAALTRWLAGR